MAASVHFRPQNRDLGMVMREVDEDLAIFLGMKNCEKESNTLLLLHDSVHHHSTGTQPQINNLLDSQIDGTEHDWLLTPSDSSLLLSLQDPVANNQTEILDCCSPTKPKVSTSPPNQKSSGEKMASASLNRRPMSSVNGKPASRQATPTRRPTLPVKSKSSRPSTPTSRATFPSAKIAGPTVRSSTPTNTCAKRSSTPVSRPSMPVTSKSGSRPATPTRKPSTPSTTPHTSASDQSSSGIKAGPTKNPMPSRGISPTVKSRPSKSSSSEMAHKRAASASRGRPNEPATRSSVLRSSSTGKQRLKSCSPSRARASNGTANKNGISVLSKSRHNNEGDDVNPVLIGTKMVERVVNMRKLAPPKQDEHVSHDNPKKPSQENSGFGRSLSKKSLDMAIRHMDITRSVRNSLRPVATGFSASSENGVRLSSANSSTIGVSESPLATNSDTSELSVNNNVCFLDGSEV